MPRFIIDRLGEDRSNSTFCEAPFSPINASSCKLVRIQDASEDIRIEAVGFYSIFDDPTTSPLLEFTPMEVSLRVWAYRLTDVFGMSNSIEPVTA